jgi:hypothetical protein
MSSDYLKELSNDDVAAWYRRLADMWIKGRPDLGFPQPLAEPLAGKFLHTWLDNRVAYEEYVFEAPAHLRSLEVSAIITVLIFHRKVFLTEAKKKDGAWGGILPRIQRGKWDMKSDLILEYESLCTVGDSFFDITRIQNSGTPAEKDIMGAMHGFQLKSQCKLSASPIKNSSLIEVRFKEWFASITDNYHWNPQKSLTMPNPDYESKDPKAVRPKDKTLLVYHSNAKRLENAGMAAPFKVRINPWRVNDARITQPAKINMNKRL